MEKSQMPLDRQSNPIPVLGFGSSEVLATGEKSGVFDVAHVKVVRIAAIADAWIIIGTNPTPADQEGAFFPAGTVEYVAVPKNEKIGVFGGGVSVTVTK
jgi:hypothetical protein